MVVNDNCISYFPSSYELFFPSPIIIQTFCVSTDKTNLFLISIMRLLVYVIVYYLLDELITFDNHHIIQYILIVMIFVNVLYLGLIVGKNTLFSIGSDQSMFSKTSVPTLIAIE